MTVDSIFIMILNIAYCVIMPWLLYYAYKQRRIKKVGKEEIIVFDSSKVIPYRWLLVTTVLYVTAVIFLWILFILGVSDLLQRHWFYYVFVTVIPVIFNHDRVFMTLGKNGISVDDRLIPVEQITGYNLKDCNSVTNRLTLEITTGNRTLRGLIPLESKSAVKQLLDSKNIN